MNIKIKIAIIFFGIFLVGRGHSDQFFRPPLPSGIVLSEKIYGEIGISCDISVYTISQLSLDNIEPYIFLDMEIIINDSIGSHDFRADVINNAQAAKDCLPNLRDRGEYVRAIHDKGSKILYHQESNTLALISTTTDVIYISRGSR